MILSPGEKSRTKLLGMIFVGAVGDASFFCILIN
jgi:hypothetical protein